MTFTRLPRHAPRKQGKEGGFALIATLSLMVLLGLIAVGILAMVSSQNRLAAHYLLQAEARQQALIGLDAAIAELQVHLGPDQRVTATSGILGEESSGSQHLLGVWNSWQAPLYAHSEGRDISSTYTTGRSSMFRTWLISSNDVQQLRRMNAAPSLTQRDSGTRVLLLGEGTLGSDSNEQDYIYADLVPMPSSGGHTAYFAWWVSGENQKANVAIAPREETDDAVEVLHRTWDTPPPLFGEGSPLAGLADDMKEEDYAKILSLKELSLALHRSGSEGQPYFFDATVHSYSLLTNVRDGGLKYDLNLLLNKKSLKDTPYAARSGQDCPIVEGTYVPTPLENHMPIGSWQMLHAYHNTWPDGTATDGEGFAARLIGSLDNAYSRLSGNLRSATTPGGDSVTFFEERVIEEDVKAGYPRSPLLVAFLGAWGLMLTDPQSGFSGHSHMVAYAPFTMWWNPYNVRIKVGAKKLWVMSMPYRTTSVFVRTDGQVRRWPMVQYLRKAVDGNGSIGMRNNLGNDWGNYLVESAADQTSDITFEAGEILVFSMAEGVNAIQLHNENGAINEDGVPYLQPQQIPFMMGDNAGELHNYAYSLYSYGERTTITNSFMLETQSVYDEANVVTLIDEGDGSHSSSKYKFDTVGEIFGPKEREAFVVPYGFDGIDASSEANKNLAESRKSSKPDRFPGAGGIAPNCFSLGWYDYDQATEEEVTFIKDQMWNSNMTPDIPMYAMAIGVVPKSYNNKFNDGLPLFRGKDYRTKVWQHSNPALGSSALYRPDDQERQYNPFQLGTMEMGAGLNRGVLDTPNGRNGVWGISSSGGDGGEIVSFIATHELPMHPPMSLAGFAGMKLKPGWFDPAEEDDFSLARMRLMQYQAGVPGVGIGNSFADPCLPPDDVHIVHENNVDSSLSANGRLFSDFYDYGFLINDELWDRWFCSSMADMPERHGKRRVEDVVEQFVKGEEKLPVSRYVLARSTESEEQIIARILSNDGWKEVARHLMVRGGFNINSVSVEAWTATLLGLSRRDLVHNANKDSLERLRSQDGGVLFSRFMVSNCSKSIDEMSYRVLEGSDEFRPDLRMTTAWGDLRKLSPQAIRSLAEEIVKQVRERGPFLNMADFINRRLDGGSDTALKGALQAAIDATDINEVFKAEDYEVQVATEGLLYSYTKAEEGSMYTAAPGYLIQSDVLASLGNILTVRDDTFVVRAYGCVRTSRNMVLAQAWCEAVVQRTIEYVDPSNTPEQREGSVDERGHTESLSPVNRLLGRRFRIVSFKWLDAWDI